jgi:hypothetical protein
MQGGPSCRDRQQKRGGVAVMALAGGAQALLLTFHSEATQYDDPLSRVDCRRDEAPRHGQR